MQNKKAEICMQLYITNHEKVSSAQKLSIRYE